MSSTFLTVVCLVSASLFALAVPPDWPERYPARMVPGLLVLFVGFLLARRSHRKPKQNDDSALEGIIMSGWILTGGPAFVLFLFIAPVQGGDMWRICGALTGMALSFRVLQQGLFPTAQPEPPKGKVLASGQLQIIRQKRPEEVGYEIALKK